ncbi:hypothetical protein quinque_013931 [Culex quinquefasciatus]
MEEITTEQLYNIIKTSASRKAPGNDGIPKEFYVRTFHVIHRQLNLVINEALNGNIPQKLVEEFEIRRSVRQGDPMSMHLFVLHLHPLLEKIRTLCNDQLDLSTAYADDISVIVVDNTKLPTLKQLFFDFGWYSGAVLNPEKTVAMKIGRSSENLPWPSMETRVKILGINFFNDHKQMIQFQLGRSDPENYAADVDV